MTAVLSNTAQSTRALSAKNFHDMANLREARPSGFARVVMSISLAMLNWAASRAERDVRSSTEQALIVSEARARQSREHAARLLQLHVR